MSRTAAALRANAQSAQSPDARFLEEARAGLRAHPKTLPCKYLYDARGSQLFERICELPEYTPTRTELEIMRASAGEMARALGSDVLLIEYGSGSSLKTRRLLDRLARPAAYLPVDISREHLHAAAAELRAEYPALHIEPVCADFTAPIALPAPPRAARRRVVYFPGSTLGNFSHARAAELLAGARALCGAGGALLIGVDLQQNAAELEAAYDDAQGVTADFNLNLLTRMNRELGADFRVERFAHRARWVAEHGRIEMHLVSRAEQVVRVGGERFHFLKGESICTEHSHKYTPEGFARLAARAGLRVLQSWRDAESRFGVFLLER